MGQIIAENRRVFIFLAVVLVPFLEESPNTLARMQPPPGEKKPRTLELPGEVAAFAWAELHSRVAGVVHKVHVATGDKVHKGQVLVELSAPDLEQERRYKEALLAQAEVRVKQAQGNVKILEARREKNHAQVHETRAVLERAKASVELAKNQLERMQKLFEQKAVDQQLLGKTHLELKAAQTGILECEARLAQARAALEEASGKIDQGSLEVRAAEAGLKVALADLQRTLVQLNFTKIQAPFDGVVAGVQVDPGETVGSPPSRPLLTVMNIDRIRVVLQVPEADIPSIHTGMKAVIHPLVRKGLTLEGELSRTTVVLEPKNRTLRAEIDLANPQRQLLPGMLVRVHLSLGKEGQKEKLDN